MIAPFLFMYVDYLNYYLYICKKIVMIKIEKRIEFLADKYNVFMEEEMNNIIDSLTNEGHEITKIEVDDHTDNHMGVVKKRTLAILNTIITNEDKSRVRKWVRIHEDIFAAMIAADPTPNKIYLQWMLTVFTKLIKDGKIDDAVRFGAEDLPQANEYLELFDNNKRKRLFKELTESNYALKNMTDTTNINQYKDLAQLFDSVDPFIERDASDFERSMKRFVDAGHALMPVRDRNFTLFIPLTRDANVLFEGFASWCTAKHGNGMFDSYTKYKTPISNKSKIYIIIDNKFLNGEFDSNSIPNDMMYQIHFESKQLRDRSNGPNKNIYDSVLSKSEALSNFFYEELTPMAKSFSGPLNENYYIDYLISFGFTDILFDIQDIDQPTIRFKKREIPKLPDLSRFKNVSTIYLGEISLRELNTSIFSLPHLEVLSIPKNKLTSLPKEIGNCKTLVFLNIVGNKITEIPEEIGQLDISRGGNLYRISVRESEIGENNYKKLKRLLPSAMLSDVVE